jgi:hypothetical protein
VSHKPYTLVEHLVPRQWYIVVDPTAVLTLCQNDFRYWGFEVRLSLSPKLTQSHLKTPITKVSLKGPNCWESSCALVDGRFVKIDVPADDLWAKHTAPFFLHCHFSIGPYLRVAKSK